MQRIFQSTCRSTFRWIGLVLAVCFSANTMAQDSAILDLYRGEQSDWPKVQVDDDINFIPLAALPQEIPFPENNQYSDAKWRLGKQLFFDRRLSKSEQLACASCHDPDLGWADGRRQAIGHNRQQHDLNSPSIVNSAWVESVFWNGRAKSLEQQIIETWQNPIEMAAHLPTVVARIDAINSYKPMFQAAFNSETVTVVNISQAIATFMRKIVLNTTKFDKFMAGQRDLFSNDEIAGLHLFRTKARCINCHNGALLTDGKFHHLGSSFHNVDDFQGRYKVTKQALDVGAFRTPGLRGLSSTAPYLHNGFIKDLDTLLTIYNNGWWQNASLEDKGNTIPTATLSSHIKPLGLTNEEIEHLLTFLKTMDGNMPWMELPEELE